ncbi:hypothetical protein MY3296_009449 [Beauveria thailandica]
MLMLSIPQGDESGSGEEDPRITAYSPPIEEFDVFRLKLGAGSGGLVWKRPGPTVPIVISGHGKVLGEGLDFEVKQGQIFFMAYHATIELRAESDMEVLATVEG